MPKNIVICLDGTGNQVGAKELTNVAKLYELLDLSQPDRQIAYYDPGVGTMASSRPRTKLGRLLSRVAGLGFGTGLKTNVVEAYTFLMNHWHPGDAVFIFGFSRGAYTARALAGMLTKPGLMRPGSDNLVPYAVGRYAINRDFTPADHLAVSRFSHAFCWRTEQEPLFTKVKANNPKQVSHHTLPIAYLGVWDTVKAAGFLRFGVLRWPFTRELPNVARIRHAVSINEHRRPYREYRVEPGPDRTDGFEEVWFAGVHSDVGGTFRDDPRLPSISMKWVLEGAATQLHFAPDAYQQAVNLAADAERGRVHRMGKIWLLTGVRRRPVPAGADLHHSVLDKLSADRTFRQTWPENVSYVDPSWRTPVPSLTAKKAVKAAPAKSTAAKSTTSKATAAK